MFNKNHLIINNAKKSNIYTFIPEFHDGGKMQFVGFQSDDNGSVPRGYLSPNVINYDNIEYKITVLEQVFTLYSPDGCVISTEPELNKQIRIIDIVTNKSTLVQLNDHDFSNNLYLDLDITIENVGKTFYLFLEIV